MLVPQYRLTTDATEIVKNATLNVPQDSFLNFIPCYTQVLVLDHLIRRNVDHSLRTMVTPSAS
jgi:hypothetical protein